jgi:hypothetical protein
MDFGTRFYRSVSIFAGSAVDRRKRQNEIHAESSTKRVLATLSQAIPARHASDANSDAPYSFRGDGGNYLSAKQKPPAVC